MHTKVCLHKTAKGILLESHAAPTHNLTNAAPESTKHKKALNTHARALMY